MVEPTTLPPSGDENALYIVDISSYVFRAYHALPPLSNEKGEPTHAVHGVTNMLLKLIRECEPARLVVAMDSKVPTLRSQQYSAYKANRRATPPDLKQQMHRVRQIVEAYEIPTFDVDGYEADDVIATLAHRAVEAGLRVVIVSADKDLLQLVSKNVCTYDTMRDRVVGVPETIDKMGVPPNQVRDLLALMGDSSDNVPGVKSVGQKTAVKLLQDYSDIDGIYAHIEEITKKALKKNLMEGREAADISRQLVTLHCDLPLDIDFHAMHWTGGDPERLRVLFVELEFTRLLNDLGPAMNRSSPSPSSPEIAAGTYETLTSPKQIEALLATATEFAITSVLAPDDALRGDLIGIGLSTSVGSGVYIPIGHRYIGAPEQPRLTAVLELLRGCLENPMIKKRSDDLKRELVLFSRFGIHLRGLAFDTMIASYLIDANRRRHDIAALSQAELSATLHDAASQLKGRSGRNGWDELEVDWVRDAAAERADYINRLAQRLEPRIEKDKALSRLFFEVELPLARVLADMERTGLVLDTELLAGLSAEVSVELDRLERRCHELAGHAFNVDSPRQLETILFDELALPVIKKTKTSRSTDSEVLEELSLQHALPEVILERRALAKLRSTYLEALPQRVIERTGRIHTRYNQAVATTGRLSSSDPNLQNIPIRTELGRKVRNAFVAPAGCEILAADYSQIELRVLAHLSRDAELSEAFATGADVHVRTATALFHVDAAGVTRHMRDQAKTVNFAVIYGQTQFALAKNLRIERREANRYIDAFFERYQGVREFMEQTIDEAHRAGQIRTILGRTLRLPDLASKNQMLRRAAERVARNAPIQGSAADIMKLAMVQIHAAIAEQGLKSRMLLTVHDELVFEVPGKEHKVMEDLVRTRMEHAYALSVPLVVDVGWGKHWGEAH